MLLSLLLFIFLPAMLVSVTLALIPWRPLTFRACLLTLHVVASVFLITLLPLRWQALLLFLGPGAALAFLRGLEAVLEDREARRSRRSN